MTSIRAGLSILFHNDSIMSGVLAKPYALTDQQVADFDRDGYLILKQQITGELLTRLQEAGTAWMDEGMGAGEDHPEKDDFIFASRPNGQVFYRVDYLHTKSRSASLELLGCPQVLAVAESLCGRNFTPTYESMVFKQEGDGEVIRWHQDAVHPRKSRIFNYDLYLDESKKGAGALYVIPGSQTTHLDACNLEQTHGWNHPDAIQVEMEPGDVLLHDVMVIHGSPRVTGNKLRRTVYYEFRAAEQILSEGPWDRGWVDKRMRMIPIGLQAYESRFPSEAQFPWTPDPEFLQTVSTDQAAELRIVHTAHTPGSYCSASSPVEV